VPLDSDWPPREPVLRAAFRGHEGLHRLLAAIRAAADRQARPAASMRDRIHGMMASVRTASTIGVLVADDDARYVAVNAGICAMTGYTEAELLTMTIWQLSAPPQRRSAERLWRMFLADGTVAGRYRLLHKSGAIVPVEYAAATHVLPGIHVSVVSSTIHRRSSQRKPTKRRQRA
jgi:PAS domain S-box-containing protein